MPPIDTTDPDVADEVQDIVRQSGQPCPDDPDKEFAGVCGCGVPDTDTDADGWPDCYDQCPDDPDKQHPGLCGCGEVDLDSDGDGVYDCYDFCPNDPDKILPGICGCMSDDIDSDGDGIADCEDDCPTLPDMDWDGDGFEACRDQCPYDVEKISPGVCGCNVPETDGDGDGVVDCTAARPAADACDDTIDSDGDGTGDCSDECPNDPDKSEPGICGCGLPDHDLDGDGSPDSCELPAMAVDPVAVLLDETTDAAAVSIRNDGGGSLTFRISGQPDWLTVSPKRGHVGADSVVVILTAQRDGLSAGEYETELTVTPNAGLAITLGVSMIVAPPADPEPAPPGQPEPPVVPEPPGVPGGPAGSMQAAARTSGIAPLAVFFDAVGGQSGVIQPKNGDHNAWFYAWDFGDPGSGHWVTSGRSRDYATGYVAAHVYEKPGTYEARLRVTDDQGNTYDYKQTITVKSFSGVTFYVSSSSGSDSNDGLSPQKPLKSFSKAISKVATNRRILFKRGDSWNVSVRNDIHPPGPGIIGAYANSDGSDDPSKPRPKIITSGGEGTFCFMEEARDWRVMDFDIVGPGGNSGTMAICGQKSMKQNLALRIRGTHLEAGMVWSVATWDHDQNFIVDCELSDTDANGLYLGGNRSALLGNVVQRTGTHVLRVWHSRKFVIDDNILHDPPSIGKASLKLHNKPGLSNPTEYVCISGNSFRGDEWPVTMGPQNTSAKELVQKCLFERNIISVQGNHRGRRGVCVFGPDITVRNNVFIGTGSVGDPYLAVSIESRGGGPVPHRARIYNNTIYRTDGTAALVWVQNSPQDVQIRNNLMAVSPSHLAGSKVIYGGSPKTENNLLISHDGLFANPSKHDFLLRAGTKPIDAGKALPGVYEDFRSQSRAMSGSIDCGAYER